MVLDLLIQLFLNLDRGCRDNVRGTLCEHPDEPEDFLSSQAPLRMLRKELNDIVPPSSIWFARFRMELLLDTFKDFADLIVVLNHLLELGFNAGFLYFLISLSFDCNLPYYFIITVVSNHIRYYLLFNFVFAVLHL